MQGQMDGQSKESTTKCANAVVIDGSVRRGSIAAISPGTADTEDPSRSCPSTWATARLRPRAHNGKRSGQRLEGIVAFRSILHACSVMGP